MALQLRPKHRSLTTPSLIHLFSTSTPDPPPPPPPPPSTSASASASTSASASASTSASASASTSTTSQSSFSSYFSDVKASLKQQQPPSPPPIKPSMPSFSPSSSQPSKVASLEEIRKNLSQFRLRSAVPPPTDRSAGPSFSPSPPISFQELYKRNVIAKSDESKLSGKLPLDAIRESLRQMRSTSADKKSGEAMSLSSFKESLRLRPVDPHVGFTVIGGTEKLPPSVFGKEMREKRESESGTSSMKTEFVKMYSYKELGEKLKKLRPEGVKEGEGWFSLEELNERLMKLREIEEKETESRIGGMPFKDLRDCLVTLKVSHDEKTRKSSIQRLDLLGHLGGTPNFMLQPPKEHLVEKYFHPDNMSSEEKMKIELAKVRDEFKMSESDCGSARVQVAQLTTKIKHLSSVLHKKDKHSRKGLVGMVQRRKKLLKYLRRTDWDSYCFVLSKLGLRDNPDYKN